MTWPLKLRATSFVIVIGVVLMESAIALLPIGIALCLFARMNAVSVIRDLDGRSSHGRTRDRDLRSDLGRQGYRRWWRQRA